MVGRPVHVSIGTRPVDLYAKPSDMGAACLDDIKPFLRRIETQLVGKLEAVGNDAQPRAIIECNEAIAHMRTDRPHPILHARAYRYPKPPFGVSEYEIDLSDGHAVNFIG